MAYFLGAVFSAYTRIKEQDQRLDFDDLIFKTRALVTEQGAETILYALDGGIDHILLDEAQDTSKEQWEVILALSAEFFCHHDPTRPAKSLCVVGDRKQSIYSFQGANSDCFEAVKAFYLASSDKWQCLQLETSFRSTPVVLESIDHVFQSPEKTPGVCNGHTIHHIPHRGDGPGIFELWPVIESEESPPLPDPWTVPKSTDRVSTAEEQLSVHIAQFIKHSIEGNTFVPSRGRCARAEDFLILMQRRGALMNALHKALHKENFVVVSTDRIALHEEILVDDLLAAACFALYPEDDLMLASLLKSPFFGWTEETLFETCRVWKNASSTSLWSFIRTRDMSIVPILEELIEHGRISSPYVFFLRVLQQTNTISGREAQEIADAFLEVTLTFAKEHTPSLERFVRWFKARSTFAKRPMTLVPGVRLMTVHGAKGLQAPFIILADATSVYERVPPFFWREDGLLFLISQTAHRIGAAQTLYHRALEMNDRESERLLYVAMTRAQDALYMTGIKRQKPLASKSWYNLAKSQLSSLLTERADALWKSAVLTFAHGSLGDFAQGDQHIQHDQGTVTPLSIPSWFSHQVEAPAEVITVPQQEDGYTRGLAIHKLLEELPKLPATFWREKGQEIVKAYAPHEVDAILNEAIEVLTTYGAFFTDPKTSEISFFSPRKGVGRIDRICATDDTIWLIDFKTDRQIPPNYRHLPPAYREQLRFYADIFSVNKKRVKVALLWTAEPLLMEVPTEFLQQDAQAYSSSYSLG
jgi:ATP-dependent helicase/nuclease subunit A